MKNAGIARRMSLVLIASVAITAGVTLALSVLLALITGSARDLAATSKTTAQGSFELLDLFVREQSLTQSMVQSSDPDVIESLMGKSDSLRKTARTRIKDLTANDADITASFEQLVQADEEVKDLLLHARNAESRQAIVEKSNPAFAKLLSSIQSYQNKTAQEIDKTAAAARFRTNLMQALIYVLVACGTVLLVLYGLALVRGVGEALNKVVERIKDVAEGEGDLTKRLEANAIGELGELAKWFNQFMDKLQGALSQVAGNTQHLASAMEHISAASNEQAKGAANQTDQTEHVAHAMQHMSSAAGQISENSAKAADAANKASDVARMGGKIVDETVLKMREIASSVTATAKKLEGLGQRSNQIGEIIAMIGGIAKQTNLLALNATIEAARAGEKGRGFAVVADEVRKLAKQTSQATQEITTVIHAIQDETKSAVKAMESGTAQVDAGVETTTQAGVLLQQIIQSAEQLVDMVGQIASAATEQSASAEKVNQNIEKISKITSATAQGAQESARACSDVVSLAQSLQEVVGLFKVEADEHGEFTSDSKDEDEQNAQAINAQPWEADQIPIFRAVEAHANASVVQYD